MVIHYICFMFSIRNLEENDYETLCEYWKWFRFPAPAREMLPLDIGDGIAVSFNNEIVCAGFLYATSSPSLFWIEWIVSNPKVKDKILREQSIILLINSITELAKQMGAKAIFTSLKHKSLLKHFDKCGYSIDSSTAIEMIKIIN